jgi:Beta-galactosidase
MVFNAALFTGVSRWLVHTFPRPQVALAALLCMLPQVSLPARADEPPTGVYSLTPGGASVPAAILTNPAVAGVSLRGQWQNVEAVEGVYNWSYFDREIKRVAASGKKVQLRIVSGGKNTPQWVFDTGVQTFSFVNSQTNTTITAPVWWDPIFLEKKKNFIAAMGRHFTANPNIVLVSTSCANSTTDDWVVPSSSADVQNLLALGYTSGKLINACKQIIDATLAAFPNQFPLMAISRGPKGLDPDVDYVAEQVVDYAMTRYPERFITQKNSLSARTWDPLTASKLHGWQVLYDARPMVAGQMLWYVTDDPTCRMNGNFAPCSPVQVLRQAVTIGAYYEMLYQEIYQQDILNPDLADVISEAAALLAP